MNRTSGSIALAATLLCIGALSLSACSRSEAPEGPRLIFHEYTVRGEVVQPVDAEDGDGLRVRHEAIPEYVGPGGRLGMNVMVMPFWPPVGSTPDDLDRNAIEARLSELQPGDKVEITFRVWLEDETFRPRGYWATGATVLPEDTVLDWTPLERPPAPDTTHTTD